jgi:hypothetical protein
VPEVQGLGNRAKSMSHIDGNGIRFPEQVEALTAGILSIDATVPASRLDMASLSGSDKICGVEVNLGEAYQEVLGELFAAKFPEAGASGKSGVPKTSKKSKKNKESRTLVGHADGEDCATSPLPRTPSVRRSRRRPSSTCGIGRREVNCAAWSPEQPPNAIFSMSLDDASWQKHSKKALTPLAVAHQARDIDLEEKLTSAGEDEAELEAVLEDEAKCTRPDSAKTVTEQDKAASRPSSADTSKQITTVADPNLWNIGFDDNVNGGCDPCVWDGPTEIYCAWGGDDDNWGGAESDVDADWDRLPEVGPIPVF